MMKTVKRFLTTLDMNDIVALICLIVGIGCLVAYAILSIPHP